VSARLVPLSHTRAPSLLVGFQLRPPITSASYVSRQVDDYCYPGPIVNLCSSLTAMTRGLSIMTTAWGTDGLGVLSGVFSQPASQQQQQPFSQSTGHAIGLPLSTSRPPVTSLSIRPRMPCLVLFFFYYYTVYRL
jgi:hypothetical protein